MHLGFGREIVDEQKFGANGTQGTCGANRGCGGARPGNKDSIHTDFVLQIRLKPYLDAILLEINVLANTVRPVSVADHCVDTRYVGVLMLLDCSIRTMERPKHV